MKKQYLTLFIMSFFGLSNAQNAQSIESKESKYLHNLNSIHITEGSSFLTEAFIFSITLPDDIFFDEVKVEVFDLVGRSVCSKITLVNTGGYNQEALIKVYDPECGVFFVQIKTASGIYTKRKKICIK